MTIFFWGGNSVLGWAVITPVGVPPEEVLFSLSPNRAPIKDQPAGAPSPRRLPRLRRAGLPEARQHWSHRCPKRKDYFLNIFPEFRTFLTFDREAAQTWATFFRDLVWICPNLIVFRSGILTGDFLLEADPVGQTLGGVEDSWVRFPALRRR